MTNNAPIIKDADDYRRIHGPGSLKELLKTAQPVVIPPPPPPRAPFISFFKPGELRDYIPKADIMLVGNSHVKRGDTFTVGGEAGVGKSRCSTALAVAGAMGTSWFGLTVHRQFRTMIIQTENGRYRLQQEYSHLPCDVLDEWIRVSEPPPFGLALTHPDFIADIRAAVDAFRPDLVIFDPWNSAAKDDKQRDYADAFDAIMAILPKGEDKPAVGIIAHTRKPQPNEKRTGGTSLKNVLAGSYMLASVPRSIFIMVRASDDETDDRVVFCNPKNNDGEMVTRTAWHRGESGFTPVEDFDWEEFENQSSDKKGVTLNHLRELFEGGAKSMELAAAVDGLMAITEVSRPTAYGLLSGNGRFARHLARDGKLISFSE